MAVIHYGMDIEALKKALAESNKRVKELEFKNRQLEAQLKKQRMANAKMRQRIKSQRGALKAQKIRVQKLRSAIKKIRATAKITSAIKSQTHRTRAQYLEQAKPEFIRRFIQRLHETYADWKGEWDEVVRVALMSLAYDEIDGIVRMLNLDSMYYESNGYRPNTGATGEMIYEYFKQFIPVVAA